MAHLVTLLAGAAFLLWVGRDQWFYRDEWAFIANRIHQGDLALLTPHNEHWSTLPVISYRAVFGLAGLRSYAPYLAVLVVAHVGVVHLLWRLSIRSGVGAWIATAGAAAFLPFGPGADNLLWAFQMGFVGSLALGLLHARIVDRPGPFGRRDVAGWGVAVLALMSSGIGVVTAAVAAVAAWFRRGWRAFLVTASVPAMVYIVWLVTAGDRGLRSHPPPTAESLRLLPEFVGRGLAATLSWGTGSPAVGIAVVAVAGVATGLRLRRGERLPGPAIACAAGAVLLFVVVGVGRTTFGLRFADASRYIYLAGALFLPLSLLGLSDPVRRMRIGAAVVGVLLLGWGLHNARLLVEAAERQAARERDLREQLHAALELHDAGAAFLRDRPEPTRNRNLQMSELVALRSSLDEDVTPSPEARLRASLALQVKVEDRRRFAGRPVAAIRASPPPAERTPDGCVHLVPASGSGRARLPAAAPSSWELRDAAGARIEILATAGDVMPRYAVAVVVHAGRAFLNSAVHAEALVLRFTEPLTICRAR